MSFVEVVEKTISMIASFISKILWNILLINLDLFSNDEEYSKRMKMKEIICTKNKYLKLHLLKLKL